MRRWISLGMVIILGLALMLGACRPAEEIIKPAEFYQGKTIEFIVPYSAGGGFDSNARMIAPYIKKYTGADAVVVNNMTGAGGMVATNHLYKSAPRDGLTIALVQGADTVTNQLVQAEGVAFDVKDFNWLCQVAAEARMVMVSGKSPYKTAADLQAAKELKLATLGKTGPDTFALTILTHVLGLNVKLVSGYKGIPEAALAVFQGEADGWAASELTAERFAQGGEAIAVLCLRKQRATRFPDTPTVYEAVKLSGENLQLMDRFVLIDSLHRIMAAPPDVPQDRVVFLQEALDKALHDKDLIAESNAKKEYIVYTSGAEVKKQIDIISKMSPEEQKRLRYVFMEEPYK